MNNFSLHSDIQWSSSHALWHVQVVFKSFHSQSLNLPLPSIKFTLMTRKKLCCECSNYFCSSCLPREQGCRTRTCSRWHQLFVKKIPISTFSLSYITRCRVLHKSPPLRGDLMKLRVKDLQHFLSKRQINIKACVGKSSQPPLIARPWYLTGSKKQLRSSLRPPLCWLFFHQEALPLSQGARNRISNCCRRSVNWLSTYFSLDLRLEIATVPEIK